MSSSSFAKPTFLALAVWAGTFALALKLGSVSGLSTELVTQLRLPRALLASGVGMGLAVSGAALQAVFSNPLCEPYTLGISSGSALGAILGVSFGLQLNFAGIAGTGFLGALAFAGILYLISLKPGSSNLTLLLAGVMLGFMGSGLVSLWMALTDPSGIQAATFWLTGDLSRARLNGAMITTGGALALGLLIWSRWRQLDALLMGEEDALALGVNVSEVRRRLIIWIALLIGLCVSGAGMIGFIGLVVPHFVRRAVGSLHLRMVPLCMIWGATSLTAADTLARLLARPYELPVGVVTALVGAPIFLWIMLSRRAAG